MAVRVQGQADTLEVRCSGCGHILEYKAFDVRTYRHDVDPEVGYITCPRLACGKTTEVPYPGATSL